MELAIVGTGAVSGSGIGVDKNFNALLTGESSIAPISAETHFDPEEFDKTCAGQTACALPMTDEELGDIAGVPAKNFDRHQLFGFISTAEAVEQSGGFTGLDPKQIGCIVGTGDGGLKSGFQAARQLLKNGRLGPRDNLKELPNTLGGYLTQRYGIRGPSHGHMTACSASAHAIGHAYDLIKLRRIKAALVVGAEAAIVPYGIGSFRAQGAMGLEINPYRKDRKGFVMGEGSGALVVMDAELASRLGLKIMALIVGHGSSSDGNPEKHVASPDWHGSYDSSTAAMEEAGVHPEQIGWLNTHGTGTVGGDEEEAEGARQRFGEYAGQLCVSSTKSVTGHLLGAAGAIEAVFSVEAIRRGVIPPTRGLTPDTLDPKCAGLDHVMVEPRVVELGHVLSNSSGFGGTNASLIFARA